MNQEPDDNPTEYVDERFESPPKKSGKGQIALGCGLMVLALLAAFAIFLDVSLQEQGDAIWPAFLPPGVVLSVGIYRAVTGPGSNFLKGVLLAVGLALLLFGLCMTML